MKLKKIILLSLAAVILLGGVIGVWLHFSKQENTNDASGEWKYIIKSTLTKFASAENGCYFRSLSDKLQFYDYETGVTVTLCSKVPCDHNSHTCDASVLGYRFNPLFFTGNHLYYVDGFENGSLTRRNATGADLTVIGIPGKKFVELQQSVSIGNHVAAGDYLYYSASATNKENAETELQETYFVGRIHLSSGKDEILFETPKDKTAEILHLTAAKDGSCLFFWQQGMDIPTTNPAYSQELKKIPVGLYRWDEETGEITALFEAPREKCENFYFVEGDWAYYNTMYDSETRRRCDNYRINIETGKEESLCENATLTYLGGGYALHRTDSVEGYRLMDLKTGEFLPVDASGVTGSIPNIYNDFAFMFTFSETIEDSMITTESTFCMIRHDSLSDGLQSEDLIPVFPYSSKTEPVTPPTTSPTDPTNPTEPTEPKDPGVFEDEQWGHFRINFTSTPQPPEEQMKKNIQYLPETVENPNDLPVLKWVFAMSEMDRTWTENAVIELNQMLSDKKMPFRVQFAILMSTNTGSPFYQPEKGITLIYDNYALLASEEAKELLKDADLIFGSMTPEEMQNLLSPITEYVNGDSEYSLQNSVAHRLDWLTTTVGGEIYGISQKPPLYSDGYYGWYVDKPLMKKAGLTPADFQKNFWEMDEVFEKLYKANGNQPIIPEIYHGSIEGSLVLGGQPEPCIPDIIENPAATVQQLIGAIFAIDDSGDSPKVVNVLESIRHIQEAVLRYQNAGYIGGKTGHIGFNHLNSATSEPYEVQPLVGNATVVIPVTAPRFDSFYGKQSFRFLYNNTIGIAATSQHKEEALMLLNLLAEDEAFRKQFLYGKEGRDYKMEDGNIIPIEGADGACYAMGSSFRGYAFLDDQDLEPYRNYADTVPSVAYPIAFDYSGYAEELENIAQILNEVYPIFFNHKEREYTKFNGTVVKEPIMDKALYDRVLEKLGEVGTDKIIADLQRQLDEWLAANPNWSEQMKPVS